jgi:hypothetical protein
MNNEHIPFNLLSDLCDGMLTDAERERISAHLGVCPLCNREYAELARIVKMVSCLQCLGIRSGDEFIRSTIHVMKKRGRWRYLRHVLPSAAVAALIMLVVGIDYISDRSAMHPGRYQTAGMSFDDASTPPSDAAVTLKEINSAHDIKKTLNILRSNRVRVVRVSNTLIEGEATPASFESVRREIDATESEAPYGLKMPATYPAADAEADAFRPQQEFGRKVKFIIDVR